MLYTIPLTFTKPPLNMNQRMHWAQKAKITKAIRHEAMVRCRAARIRKANHITVQLPVSYTHLTLPTTPYV